LKGKSVDLSLVEERIKHCILVGKYDGNLYVMVGKDADVFEKKYLSLGKDGLKEFKGRSACKGKVTAIAKVVLNNNDFKKINRGEILVVMNTSPDFVPILGKSAAIVAEEGGITAHASVISRELNIPCVVGISHITQYIKDGDKVEVDANNGIVKILERTVS
jgi:pyruvate,water dikinase